MVGAGKWFALGCRRRFNSTVNRGFLQDLVMEGHLRMRIAVRVCSVHHKEVNLKMRVLT